MIICPFILSELGKVLKEKFHYTGAGIAGGVYGKSYFSANDSPAELLIGIKTF